MKNQWKLTAAILYGGVMMYGSAGAAGASGAEPGNPSQAAVPNATSQGEAHQGRLHHRIITDQDMFIDMDTNMDMDMVKGQAAGITI